MNCLDCSIAPKKKELLMIPQKGKQCRATLGIVRLDYDYPPAPGDIDHPDTFAYDVLYYVVPGLTFEICQAGKMTPAVEKEFIKAIKYFEQKGVKVISGDCGFMMWFQPLAREYTHIPVTMSALAQMGTITCAFSYEVHHIVIITANAKSLSPMRHLIAQECGVDPHYEESVFFFYGADGVPGFEAVALGQKVDTVKMQQPICDFVKECLVKHPTAGCVLMECTELGAYSDIVRMQTGLPVFDAITNCDFFMSACQDNPRFGINDWQEKE